jgi:hypothetical protein
MLRSSPFALLLLACAAPEPSALPVVTIPTLETVAHDTPRRLVYEGELVHPLCVYELVRPGASERVDLRTCHLRTHRSGATPPEREGARVRHELPGRGLLGRVPFFEYEVVAWDDEQWLAGYQWGAGGTRVYSGLVVVALHDDELHKRWMTSGSDCQHGLVHVRPWGAGVRFALNLTPVDMLELSSESEGLPHAFTGDLLDTPGSCFADGRFHYDFDEGRATLLSVSLRAEKAVYRPELARADRQPCFDRLFNDRRGALLSPEELDAFVETVEKSCFDD